MNNVENNLLLFKKRKFKLFKVFDLFIRTTLTMVGTLPLVSILMFLNNYFGVSYFSCFLMALVMPNLYSNIINVSLKELDKIEVLGDCVVTVENLTSFHDYNGAEDFVIYLGGFHNTTKRKFLMYLYIIQIVVLEFQTVLLV